MQVAGLLALGLTAAEACMVGTEAFATAPFRHQLALRTLDANARCSRRGRTFASRLGAAAAVHMQTPSSSAAGESDLVDDTAIYRALHKVGGGMFYRGVRGRSCGRGGNFPASSPEAVAAFAGFGLGGTGGSEQTRLLLENRNDQYEEVFGSEMKAFEGGALAPIAPGLWRSPVPLDRQGRAVGGEGSLRVLTLSQVIAHL